MAGAKNHDYHILPPSPWPLLTAFSALVLASGFIMYMHSAPYGELIGPVGFAMVLFCMASWWADVVKEAHAGDHTPVVLHRPALRHDPVHRLRGDVLRRLVLDLLRDGPVPPRAHPLGDRRGAAGWATWPPKGVETVPTLPAAAGQHADPAALGHHGHLGAPRAADGDRKGAKIGLLLTILLGVLFTSIQAYEYHHILTDHLFFAASGELGLYGSSFFMATGFHGFHVIIGTIFLTVCLLAPDGRRLHARRSTSASRRRPGTGTSSTWCGCSCSPSST